jgi:hypothetical protein
VKPDKPEDLDLDPLDRLLRPRVVYFGSQFNRLVISVQVLLAFNLERANAAGSQTTQARGENDLGLSHFDEISADALLLEVRRILNQDGELHFRDLFHTVRGLVDRHAYFILAFQVDNTLVLQFLEDADRRGHAGEVTGKGESVVENVSTCRNVRKLGKHFPFS